MVSVEKFQDYCRERYRTTGKTIYFRFGNSYHFHSVVQLKHNLSEALMHNKEEIEKETKTPIGLNGFMEALLAKQNWYLELWNFLMYGDEGWFVDEDNR